MAPSRGLGALSARLDDVGKSVTRTPSTSRSKTSASPPRLSAAPDRAAGRSIEAQNILDGRLVLIVKHSRK